MSDPEESNSKFKRILELGQDVAGGVGGGIIGAIVDGPVGAIAGGALGPTLVHTLRTIGSEISNRYLGNREMTRIGATFLFAVKKVQDNIDNGQKIREDDFFGEQSEDRSIAEEVVEGTLLVSQREHEEKKLRFYGNLVANIAFHPEIDRAQANLLLRLSSGASYRQLCALAIFSRTGKSDLRDEDYTHYTEQIDKEKAALLQEIYDLYTKQMLLCLPYRMSGSAMTNFLCIKPSEMGLIYAGETLFELMELWTIDPKDLKMVEELLL